MRKLCVLIGVMLVVTLATTATAAAKGTWVVKNESGKKIGTVRLFSKPRADGVIARVANTKGARRGFIYRKANGGYMSVRMTSADEEPRAWLQARRYGDWGESESL